MIDLLETRYTKYVHVWISLDFTDLAFIRDKSKQDICSVLEGLTKVRRIDMLVMFLDRKHQSGMSCALCRNFMYSFFPS